MPGSREAERTRSLRANATGLIASLAFHVLLVLLVLAVETTPKPPERPRVDLKVLEKPAPPKAQASAPEPPPPPTPPPAPDARRVEAPKKTAPDPRVPLMNGSSQ